MNLEAGGLLHFGTRLPHAVEAVEPTKLLLTMLDPRSITPAPLPMAK